VDKSVAIIAMVYHVGKEDTVVVCNRKRKADILTRVAEGTTSTTGRGAVSGWTTCPLCGRHSQKRFALGRGITAHLHAVHTPWNPGNIERKKRRRLIQRQEAERKRNNNLSTPKTSIETPLTWDPTEKEQEEWAERVLQIAAELEKKVKSNGIFDCVKPGFDRNGKQSQSYRESLPPFLQAAADGDLTQLKSNVEKCRNASSVKGNNAVRKLLDTRDRNGSTAEHWASGGGHLACLKFLLELRDSQPEESKDRTTRIRRRDGKTCLHYAARNGHLDCIQYLLQKGNCVDEKSGEGTTPLHMACYGGHANVVEFLIANGANVHETNEWGCGCAHWAGMTKSESCDDVRALCQVLKTKKVSFHIPQKQGHSPLHKASQRQNRHVIEWMAEAADQGGAGLSPEERRQASEADVGGHRPSEIWRSIGGDESFAEWMKRTFEFEFE
jgi:hypothetical protein